MRVEEEGMDDRGSRTELAVKGRWVPAGGYIGEDGEEGHVDEEEERMGICELVVPCRGKSTRGCRSYAAKSHSRYFN